MSGRIGQRLAPGEQLICRLWEGGEKRDWRRVLIVTAVVLAGVLVAETVCYFVMDDGLQIGLAIAVGLASVLSFAESNLTDAAVTDRRLFVVTGWNPTITTEVRPDEIAKVEVLRGGLRLRRRGQPPVLLARRHGAADFAAAVAKLAGLPPPPHPGSRDAAAARVMLASILTTGYAAGLGCLVLVAQLPWAQESDGLGLFMRHLPIAAALPGALLGTLVGLVLVRRTFTRSEMRAWIEGSLGFAQAVDAGGLCARLARRYRALADRL